METILERLPFVLQKEIMEYAPRLEIFPNTKLLRKHFEKKYCKECGEYIDLYHHRQRKPPQHFHYKKKKFKYEFRSWIYRYEKLCFYLHFWKHKKTHSLPYNVYTSLLNQTDLNLSIEKKYRIVYRQKSIRFFYDLRDLITNKTNCLTVKINTIDMNIYTNPDIFLKEFGDYETIPALSYSKIVLFENVGSSFHKQQISKIISNILKHRFSYFNMFSDYLENNQECLFQVIEDNFESFFYFITHFTISDNLLNILLHKFLSSSPR